MIEDLVEYVSNTEFMNLTEQELKDMFNKLHNEIEWKQEVIQVYGKWHETSRMTGSQGEMGTKYKYAGSLKESVGWTDTINSIRDKVEQGTGNKYNFVLCNYYPNGLTQLGYHSDTEKGLDQKSDIASVSFGTTRTFKFQHKLTKETHDYELEPGSLILMKPGCQNAYKHCIPVRKRIKEPRINLTFRKVL